MNATAARLAQTPIGDPVAEGRDSYTRSDGNELHDWFGSGDQCG